MKFGEVTRFEAAAGEGLRIRRFCDEAVVFNPSSGDTHLLAGPIVAVVEALASGEKSYPDFRQLLQGQFPSDNPTSRVEEYLEDALSELVRLDLINVLGV